MEDLQEDNPERLPKGFQIIPLNQESDTEIVGIGLVLQKSDGSDEWKLIFLHDKLFYKAYLGCLFDKEKRVLNWLEICVQQTSELLNAPIANKAPLTNCILEKRWSKQVRAMEVLLKDTMLKTLWENRSPLPGYINLAKGEFIYPKDPRTNSHLELCRDETILAGKQLPSFRNSLYRYLYIPAAGQDSLLFPVTQDAPCNSSTGVLAELLPEINDSIPFNPGAGFLMCKKYYPLGLESLMDVLSQSPQGDPLGQGKISELFPQVKSVSSEYFRQKSSGRLFGESLGLNGIMPETFLLKLRLFYQITATVQKLISKTKLPVFTLDLNSWQVNLLPAESSLPSLWATQPILTNPGESVSIKISGTNQEYFLYAPAENSVFRPSIASLPTSGDASIRIRRIFSESGQIVVEGTFNTDQRINVNPSDLVWLRLNLPHGTAELFVHLESDSALAYGEWRFRSLPYTLQDLIVQDLYAAEGVPLFHVSFDTILHLNTPVDLYSLAVLAVRLFFVDQTATLPMVLDEVLSLAHQLAHQYDPKIPLASRIENLFSEDPRWTNSLGPHHLIYQEIPAEEAYRYIPASLWRQFLAVLVKMFPGIGPDSEFRNYGDLSFDAPELAFNNTLEQLSLLIRRAKPLVFSNWNQNKQILELIETYMEK